MDKDLYTKSIIKLINSNYFHISVNKDILAEAAAQSSWGIKFPFTNVLDRLREPNADLESSAAVMAEFLYNVWNHKADVLEERKKELTTKLISVLLENRSRTDALYVFNRNVERIFLLSPLIKEKILTLARLQEGNIGYTKNGIHYSEFGF